MKPMKPKKKPQSERAFLREVGEAFDAASDMVGCGDPETFDDERRRLRKLRAKTLCILRYALKQGFPLALWEK